MLIDLFCKIQYYRTTRFFKKEVEDIYKLFLFIRPACLAVVSMYGFCVGVKEVWGLRRTHNSQVPEIRKELIPLTQVASAKDESQSDTQHEGGEVPNRDTGSSGDGLEAEVKQVQ